MPNDIPIETMKFGIGQPVLRTEDPRLLTGRGKYADDYSAPGQAYAYLVRSQHAHGEIRAIDTTDAAAAPGVLAVYTGRDLQADGVGDLPCGMPLKSRDGSGLITPPHPAVAVDRVRHVGDPYAVVIAETLSEAKDAAELIQADIVALPALTDAPRATEVGAQQLWEMVPGNVCLDFSLGNEATVDAAFAKAAHVTRVALNNTRMVVNAMEPRAAVAQYDPSAERFTLHVPSQGVAGFRGTMAGVFKITPDKIRVVSDDVGGSFGMKGMAFVEPVVVLFAARKLGRPVKWCAERTESFLSDHNGRASKLDAELALDKDGNFLATRFTGYGDMGAYLTAMGPAPPTMVTSRNIASVYRTPTIGYAVKCAFTNTVPTGPYRGAGRPESKYFLERLIDRAARETGHDRIELRRRNLIPTEDMPYEVPVGITYDSGEFESILDEATAASDWVAFAARRGQSEKAGRLRGIAIVPYLETTAPSGTELADIRFQDDDTVTLITGTRDFGTGHAAPFAQVLSDRLGVPFDRIHVVQNDSDIMSEGGGGSGGSRSVIATGGAMLEVSEKIIENGRKLAAHVLEAADEDVEFTTGAFRVAGTDRAIGMLDLAKEVRQRKSLPKDLPATLDAKVNHTTSPSSYPNGCHVCEVEVDPETGDVEMLRYTVVDDFGVVINPLIVAGQVHGGVVQGLGQVLLEQTVYDDDGQLITGSYMDYAMPRASDMCGIDFTMHPVPCTTNPLGAKGCGEAGNGGSLPVVMNAVMDALATRGVEHLEMPATPYRVWTALQAANGS